MTVKVGIFGANGRMGRVLVEALQSDEQTNLHLALVREQSQWLGVDVGELSGIGKVGVNAIAVNNASDIDVDVMIDFTLPDALEANLAWCVANKLPLVVGTTGLSDAQKQLLQNAAQSIPIVFSANMSVGVNLLFNLVRQTARVMGETADIEIWEAHHRFKQDAPSGTAVAIGEEIADELGRDLKQHAIYGREGHTGERDPNTIGFATIRAGDIVGEHTVLFAELGERIELTHKASSRLTFAKGAVRAASWIAEKSPKLYSMQDVLGLNQFTFRLFRAIS